MLLHHGVDVFKHVGVTFATQKYLQKLQLIYSQSIFKLDIKLMEIKSRKTAVARCTQYKSNILSQTKFYIIIPSWRFEYCFHKVKFQYT